MKGPGWTDGEDELVRALPPADAARRTGRTLAAVYARRFALGCAGRHLWTPDEDQLARTLPAAEAARRTGRTIEAVNRRRRVLRRAAGLEGQ